MPYGKRTHDLLLYAEIDQRLANIEEQTEVAAPVYIVSRHRSTEATTPRLLDEAHIPYQIVVEPHDQPSYANIYPPEKLVTLPLDNQGLAYTRNHVIEHAYINGYLYAWMFDDDLKGFEYRHNGKRYKTGARPLMSITEQITFRHNNVGVSSISNAGYLFGHDGGPPLVYNSMVYQSQLIRTDTGIHFRHGTQDDADFSLQMLHAGWVTLVSKRYGQTSAPTGVLKGGLLDTEYQHDGRTKLFEQLLKDFPGSYKIGYRPDGRPHLRSTGYYRRFTQLPRPLTEPQHLVKK